MGSVWLAEHTTLKTEVAVKFISKTRLTHDETLRVRFEREATIAAQLKSAHTVRVFDHGHMDDGTPYIVMERLEGTTLAERLATERPTPMELTAIIDEIARSLTEAHGLGIVHRDLKPSNIFLADAAGEATTKVIDWGIALPIEQEGSEAITATDVTVGTPPYMNPERLLDPHDVDAGADMWALSVIVYEALTGRRPFAGKSAPAITLAICDGRYTPASSISSLPEAIDAWFRRAFHMDREQRFTDVGELAAELRAALDTAGEPPTRERHGTTTATVTEVRPPTLHVPRWVIPATALAAIIAGAYVLQPRSPISQRRPPAPMRTAPPRPLIATSQSTVPRVLPPAPSTISTAEPSPPTIPAELKGSGRSRPAPNGTDAATASPKPVQPPPTASITPPEPPIPNKATRPAWCDTERGLYYQDGRYHVPEACRARN